MSGLMSDAEVFHYWRWLTEEQQEAYTEASIAWRKARDIVTSQIEAALEEEA